MITPILISLYKYKRDCYKRILIKNDGIVRLQIEQDLPQIFTYFTNLIGYYLLLKDKIKIIFSELHKLSEPQIDLIELIIGNLNIPFEILWYNNNSDLTSASFVSLFGDYLKVHHCLSVEALSKDRFEYALEDICQKVGFSAELAPRGNPGRDITIDNKNYSLKTQADKQIKQGSLWVSKFMELGKGEWTDKIEHLEGLRDQFIEHMSSYERIFQLRCLSNNIKNYTIEQHHYELIEIPKSLLLEAALGLVEYSQRSKQLPKIGWCNIYENKNKLKFQLYFDGGGERKLHIKNLDKQYCIRHAEWMFSLPKDFV